MLAITLFSCSVLSAQFVADYLKAADEYFHHADYNSAAEYYDKFLGTNKKTTQEEYNPYKPQNAARKKDKSVTTREQAIYRLGECYRLLNFPSKAEGYYKKIIDMGSNQFPLVHFHYATQLRALAKYEEAGESLKIFLAAYKTDDNYRRTAERELQNLAYIMEQLSRKDLKYYSVKKAPAELNTTGANYAPSWLGTDGLLFTSTRPADSPTNKKIYTNRIYKAHYSKGIVTDVIPAGVPQNEQTHHGTASISPDGKTMYFTRWSVSGTDKSSAIFSSFRTDDGWSEPVMLDETVNAAGASAQQPYITGDGKLLFFSSNKSGGMGGFDLWFAPISNGKAGSAINLGATINTAFDEQAPFYHHESGTLVFSSNGRVGMGGFDFFKSKGSNTSWSEPENLGYPVNSIKDDIYFVSRGPAKNILEDVMLSSDREADCCLELYSLHKVIPVKQVSGKVVSCETKLPMAGVTVNFINTQNNAVVLMRTTGKDGSYSLTLDEYQPLKAVANFPGYVEASITFNAPGNAEDLMLNNPDICLDEVFPPAMGTIEVIDNIYFDFDKAEIREESFAALDKLAEKLIKNPLAVLEISGHTDSKGTDDYNQKLSEDRARNCVSYLVGKGVNADQLVSAGYGEKMPVEPNENSDGSDNPQGREKNRRIEFKVLKDK